MEHTIYVLRDVAKEWGRYVLDAKERARLDQYYAAVTYGDAGMTYAHPDVDPAVFQR